eukprot:2634640-Alexandrium_andersonii.AAC.1
MLAQTSRSSSADRWFPHPSGSAAMPSISHSAAGALSASVGNTVRGVAGLRTPRGAPVRIQGARSRSGSPATSAKA